jgi:hypothetical protein
MPNIINERREQTQFAALRKLREAYREEYRTHGPADPEKSDLFKAIEGILALGLPAAEPVELALELPYRRAVQLTAYSPNEVTKGFYAAVAEDGTMWLLPWDEFRWRQVPCLPTGEIVL